jgi:hypothetical protein
MANSAASLTLATQARRIYAEELVEGLVEVQRSVAAAARELRNKAADPANAQKRRDASDEVQRRAVSWQQAAAQSVRNSLGEAASATRARDLPRTSGRTLFGDMGDLSLVDDDTIEREILSSRLSLAITDKSSWEFADLRSRIASLERRDELEPQDMLRPHVLAKLMLDAWRSAGLSLDAWRELQTTLHEELSLLVEEAYHETNRWLKDRHVLPEIDLRPLIRRSRSAPRTGFHSTRSGDPSQLSALPTGTYASRWSGRDAGPTAVQEETRLMTRSPGLRGGGGVDHGEAVLDRLNRLIGRQLPGFADTARQQQPASPRLRAALQRAEVSVRARLETAPVTDTLTTPVLLQQLDRNKQALKQAAETPVERATIEIVALLFQSILQEERIPATVRVWFARLQMPVLRVAISEPDFFATVEHPARRLIDRMGACVMGFDSSARAIGDALEKEIKRVVQVVEAYPDTGRRVFQTVLTEFERFLEHYFKNENEASRKGVSLAQQVEQRETLAIQYTIELRKMLEGVPVQEGVRMFLFQVWADVLAMTAVKAGPQGEDTKAMKRAAADLIWSAGAKVSREERAEVIRRLPPLLKTLREGMASAGLSQDKQDEQIHILNNALAAAFTAKSAVIPSERLQELTERLETIEEMLPEAADVQIDESLVLDLSGHESSELEVVADGGSMPTPAMLAWSRELQVGAWFMLDYRGRNEPVQLAWQGLRRQLSLFVSGQGRCVLFQQQRLAAFLQAGLLLPAQDEALTVRATRSALAKLDVDPDRLLG